MIRSLSSEIPVRFLCQYFSVNVSRFYKWKKSLATGRSAFKEKLCAAIRKEFKASKCTYGSPRIFENLKDLGIKISENTVAKYMLEMGLDARHKKKFRVMTTDSNHDGPIAPRLFKTECEDTLPSKPGEVLAGDITYLRLGNKFIYLAVVLDVTVGT